MNVIIYLVKIMLIKDLTLQDFENFIHERIFENMEFQEDYETYLARYGNRKHLFESLIKIRMNRKYINKIYGAYLMFGLQIEKTEMYQFSNINLTILFDEFIDLKKLEDVKSKNVHINYYSSDEYAFDFDFTLWIKEE
jgi:hypothetical protein